MLKGRKMKSDELPVAPFQPALSRRRPDLTALPDPMTWVGKNLVFPEAQLPLIHAELLGWA